MARDVKGKSVVVQPLIYSSRSSTQLKHSSLRGGRLFCFVHVLAVAPTVDPAAQRSSQYFVVE